MNSTKINNKKFFIIAVIVIIALFGLFKNQNNSQTNGVSTLEKVKTSKTIRVGYAAYPPYVMKDLKTGKLSGFYIDIMNEMAMRAGWKIEWVETTWQTYISDLRTGKFDVIDDPIFASVTRWQEINFAIPLSYLNDNAGLIRKDEYRFSKIEDLNKKGITIAVHQGDTAQGFVAKNLPLATMKVFSDDSLLMGITDVVSGNSDVVFGGEAEQRLYLEKNPNQNAKPLVLNTKTPMTPAGWAIKKGDPEWLLFLNGSIQSMKDDGTIKNIAKKYHLYSYEIESKFVPQ